MALPPRLRGISLPLRPTRVRLGAGETARRDEGQPPTEWQWTADSVRLAVCYGAFGFGYIIPGTFLPTMARQAIHDPAVFGWAWPVFGGAAALSALGAAAWSARIGNRHLWVLGHVVMAVGVAVPVWRPGIGSVMLAALLVGGRIGNTNDLRQRLLRPWPPVPVT